MPGALDSLGGTARDLLTRFGKDAVLRKAARVYSPTTGKTTDVATDYAVVVGPPSPYRQGRVDGVLVRVGDAAVMMARDGAPAVPVSGDRLVLDGQTWQVVNVSPTYSGQLVAVWELQLRR